ncbi:hypothetical protein WA026_009270 [Henosepilachna vigintioctopunctata]|uniref:Uncharacterized protein n=1 Tax=Henosepilachna vigintioctopunctata TaxID=420089 RepID=A0AAW1UYF4_9CUCU
MQSINCISLFLVIFFSTATAFLWSDDDCNYYCAEEEALDWITGIFCNVFCYDAPDETTTVTTTTANNTNNSMVG